MNVLLFDEPIKISAERLQSSYLVSLRELQSHGGNENKSEKTSAGMKSSVVNESEEEEEAEEEQLNSGEVNAIDGNNADKAEDTPAIKRKGRGKRRVEADYDLDDPFIDDSEMRDACFSVFDLMCNASANVGESLSEDEKELPVAVAKTEDEIGVAKMENVPARNYFVYRGLLTADVISKEFHMPLEDVLAGFSMRDNASSSFDDNDDGSDVSANEANGERNFTDADDARRKRRRKRPEAEATKKKKIKKTPVQSKSERKRGKKSSATLKKTTELFSKIFDAEDGNNSSNSSGKQSQPSSPLKKTSSISGQAASIPIAFDVNGLDCSVLELRLTMGKFYSAAKAIEIQTGKFPSALRPHLDESLLVSLRALPFLLAASASDASMEASLLRPLPSFISETLASFLPFSPAAVDRLLVRKIMLPLRTSIHESVIPKLLELWRDGVEKRLKEPGAVMTMSSKDSAGTEVDATAENQATETILSQKRLQRLKFNDELRQLIFDIVRAEGDLLLLDQALVKVRDEEPLSEEHKGEASQEKTVNVASVLAAIPLPNDLSLRRQVWNKLLSHVYPMIDAAFLNATDLNREYTTHRRKHEKKVSKMAGEIALAEEVNAALGALIEDSRKKSASAPPASSIPDTKHFNPLASLFEEEETKDDGNNIAAASHGNNVVISID